MIERALIKPILNELERLATIQNAPASSFFPHAVRDSRAPVEGPTYA